MDDDLLSILRCPATGQPLERRGTSFVSRDGGQTYPVVGDVPVLIDDSASIFSSAVAASATASNDRTSMRRRLARRLIPSSTESIGSDVRYAELARLVRELSRPRRPRLLVVGGAEAGQGIEQLLGAADLDVVETDVYLGPRVAVVCDGHSLPFADGSFDAVIAQAVLEHVLDPAQVVREIHRVLRHGGLVYAETPFMQQVHEGPFDFTRFTELGHRRLFKDFVELDRGVVVGPATALVWSLRYFARSLPRHSHTAATLLDKLATLAFFWLKYLDRILVSHPGAGDGASGVFFLGRRAEEPTSDCEILSTYRGAIRSVAVSRGFGD